MITVYYCQTSYASHKVLLYLAEKKLPFLPKVIDLRKQEHITSDYRKINPKGTVPSMIDTDGKIITNSTEIMERLEAEHPTPPLLPKNKLLRQKIHALCRAHEALHDPHIRTLSYANLFMAGDKRDQLDVEGITALAKKHPNPERGEFLSRAIQGKLTEEEISLAKAAVITALEETNNSLLEYASGFVIGETYSMADCVCTASIFRVSLIGMADDIAAFPALVDWYAGMKLRESFEVIV